MTVKRTRLCYWIARPTEPLHASSVDWPRFWCCLPILLWNTILQFSTPFSYRWRCYVIKNAHTFNNRFHGVGHEQRSFPGHVKLGQWNELCVKIRENLNMSKSNVRHNLLSNNSYKMSSMTYYRGQLTHKLNYRYKLVELPIWRFIIVQI